MEVSTLKMKTEYGVTVAHILLRSGLELSIPCISNSQSDPMPIYKLTVWFPSHTQSESYI